MVYLELWADGMHSAPRTGKATMTTTTVVSTSCSGTQWNIRVVNPGGCQRVGGVFCVKRGSAKGGYVSLNASDD